MSLEFLLGVWFFLWALLWAVYFMLDGFDLGAATLMPFIAKNDDEKRTVYNSSGPFWDGNEVWLITAGGAMFASFSDWYASLFSGYYILLFFTLFALIIRGVSFEFSAHAETERGFRIWTRALFWGSLLAPFFLTMMFGSLIQGVPIDAQGNMSLSFWNIVNPLSVVAGVAGVLLCLIHGINFLRLRIDDPELSKRAANLNEKLYLVAYLGEIVFALLIFFQTDFFKLRPISSTIITLLIVVLTAWSDIALIKNKQAAAFVTSGLTLVAVVGLLFNGLFPRVLIATDPAHSLLIKNAANSKLTLEVMTIVALILLPIALAYIIWSYVVFRHRIKVNQNA